MSPRVAARRWALALRLAVTALVWSTGLVLAALLVPAYGHTSASAVDGLTLTSTTLVQSKGAGAFLLVIVPAVVSAGVLAAMVASRRGRLEPERTRTGARVAVAALAVESLLGILSVGAYMLPAAVLLAVAVSLVPAADAIRTREPDRAPGAEPAGQPSTGPAGQLAADP